MRGRDCRGEKFIGFYAPPQLKRDLWKIAKAEDRSLSDTCTALLRLGIGRRFEQISYDPAVERLKALFEEVVSRKTLAEAAPPIEGKERWPSAIARRKTLEGEFDAAVDEGLREFETSSRRRPWC